MNDKLDRKILKWFGHLERMIEKKLIKIAYECEVEGTRDRADSVRGFLDEIKSLYSNSLVLSDLKVMCTDEGR